MDAIDKQLIDAIQVDFPLVSQPYTVLAEQLGIRDSEVLERLRRLETHGVIRRIGAVFSTTGLKMATTLAAVRVKPGEEIETVAKTINQFPEVTHNYQRDHEYELWFTAAAPDAGRLQHILDEVRHHRAVDDLLEFPARRTFKIDARFRTYTR